jgi:3'-phosphoadenosine 5'-phosphosulfate sulfotransferase (PAPS reductase)/FAD synthetase
MFKNNSTFFPTPYNIARKMCEKIDMRLVKYILEPSAGKADLIEHYKKYYETYNSRWMGYNKKADDYITFDAIEIDSNL